MGNQGDAKWASPKDLKNAGLFKQAGVFLGSDPQSGKNLYYGGNSHIFTLAPPDTGKTAAVAIPSLLENPASMVVTDPKGALTAQTALHRHKNLGHKIIVLNPFRDELTKDLGQDLGDIGFNPLSVLTAADPALIDNAEMMAALICPTPHDVRDPVWTQTSADVLTGLLLFMVHHPRYRCTLPELYNLVRLVDHGEWGELAKDMASQTTIDLEAYIATIQENLKSERQWAGVIQAMHNATRIYNPQKALSRHVSRNEFDPDDLKRELVTVYIVVPNKRREANKAWLGLVVGLFAEAVGKAGTTKRVTFLCEEFQNLGFLPSIGRAMAEYREAGLQVHLIVQTMKTLRTIYGRDGADALIDLCMVRQYFGIVDLELAENLQKSVGTYTGNQTSQNVQRERFDINIGEALGFSPARSSESTSEIGIPLLRAQDALNLGNGEQIILVGGATPPIKARLHYYFSDPVMIQNVASNPYRPPEPKPPRKMFPHWHTIKDIIESLFIFAAFILLLAATDGHIPSMIPYLIPVALLWLFKTSNRARTIAKRIGKAAGMLILKIVSVIGFALGHTAVKIANFILSIGALIVFVEIWGWKEPVLIRNLVMLYYQWF